MRSSVIEAGWWWRCGPGQSFFRTWRSFPSRRWRNHQRSVEKSTRTEHVLQHWSMFVRLRWVYLQASRSRVAARRWGTTYVAVSASTVGSSYHLE